MKVQGFTKQTGSEVSINKPEMHIEGKKEVAFNRKLNDSLQVVHEGNIKASIDAITEQGKKLSMRADLKELHIYKEMIKSLIQDTVSNAFEFAKSSQFGSRGRSKVYALINRIDEELDEMTKIILNKEEDNINLISKVDDIRGMLVDMLL